MTHRLTRLDKGLEIFRVTGEISRRHVSRVSLWVWHFFKKFRPPIWKVDIYYILFFFQKFSKKVLTHMTHRLTRLRGFWAHESLRVPPPDTEREGQTQRSPLGRARDRDDGGSPFFKHCNICCSVQLTASSSRMRGECPKSANRSPQGQSRIFPVFKKRRPTIIYISCL